VKNLISSVTAARSDEGDNTLSAKPVHEKHYCRFSPLRQFDEMPRLNENRTRSDRSFSRQHLVGPRRV